MHLPSKKILAGLTLMVILFSLVPQPAYATPTDSFLGIGSIASNAIFDSINLVLDWVNRVVLWGITQLGNTLRAVINLQVSTGGDAVYTIWSLLKGFVNMFFIIALILIAFGTIFDTFKGSLLKSYSVYQPGVISGFLIAVLVVNFSLAIGQAITETSNKVSSILLNTLQLGNFSEQIGGNLDIAHVGLGSSTPEFPAIVADLNLPDNALSINQKRAIALWPPSSTELYVNCVKNGNKSEAKARECYGRALIDANSKLTSAEKENLYKQISGINAPLDVALNIINGNPIGAYFAAKNLTTSGDTRNASLLTLSKLYRFFLLLVLLISFLVVFVFMFVRIPFIWLLLAISPIAWASKAFPGNDLFDKWWKQFWAWNIFSPLYILVIFIGTFMLNRMNDLVASMGTNGGSLLTGFLATTLGYTLIGLIFVGGSAMVLGMSQFSGTYAGNTINKVTGFLGFDKEYGAVGAVAQKTGITPYAQALGARAQQDLGDRYANLKGRLPGVFGSSEDALASARRGFGVRGGDDEVQKALTTRVDGQKKILEGNFQKRLDAATTDAERKALNEENVQNLKATLRSGNRDAGLAAAEILLAKGKLTDREQDEFLQKYGAASPAARKDFQKRITEQSQKTARKEWEKYLYAAGEPNEGQFDLVRFEKAIKLSGGKSEDRRKFLESALQGEVGNRAKLSGADMLQLTELLDNNEDKRAFLDSATKNGRNKIAAIETMAGIGLLVDRNGKKVETDDALTERAESFSPEDLLDADTYYAKENRTMPASVERVYKKALGDREKSYRMLKNVSGADQTVRLYNDIAVVASEEKKKEETIEGLARDGRKLLNEAKELRAQARKDPANKQVLQDQADQAEDRREKIQSKISQIRKS